MMGSQKGMALVLTLLIMAMITAMTVEVRVWCLYDKPPGSITGERARSFL